jgi:hypothetical protein
MDADEGAHHRRGYVAVVQARPVALTDDDWLDLPPVSMVDGELFDKLGKIGQVLRRNPAPFGGLQVRQPRPR